MPLGNLLGRGEREERDKRVVEEEEKKAEAGVK